MKLVFKALAEQTRKIQTRSMQMISKRLAFREGRNALCGAEPADYAAVDADYGKIGGFDWHTPKDPAETLNAATEAVIRGKVIAKAG